MGLPLQAWFENTLIRVETLSVKEIVLDAADIKEGHADCVLGNERTNHFFFWKRCNCKQCFLTKFTLYIELPIYIYAIMFCYDYNVLLYIEVHYTVKYNVLLYIEVRAHIYVYMCVYNLYTYIGNISWFVCDNDIYPTPPLGQDMTEGRFF